MTSFSKQLANSCTSSDNLLQQWLGQLTFYETVANMPHSLIQLLANGSIRLDNSIAMQFSSIPCYMALSVQSGRINIILEHTNFILEENMMILIDCNKPHELASTQEGCNIQLTYFCGGSATDFFEYFSNDSYTPVKTLNFTVPTVHYESFMSPAHSTTINFFHNNLILTEMLTNMITVKEHSMNREHLIPKHVKRLKEILDNYYSANHSLDSLAATLHVSKYKLNRDFSKTYSVPPIAYLNKRRITVAKNLLRSTDLSINEIGRTVGFENTNHFINLFKRDTGITPLVYRKSFTDTYIK